MDRDDLGIYIPRRLSTLTPDEILTAIDELRAQRAAMLQDIASRTPAKQPRKEKAVDLTRVSPEDALVIMAVQLGIDINELKQRIAQANGS